MHPSISLINMEPALLLSVTPRYYYFSAQDIKQSMTSREVVLSINLLFKAALFSVLYLEEGGGGGRRDVFQNLTVIEDGVSPPVQNSKYWLITENISNFASLCSNF